MGLIDAGAAARLDRYIGYYEPYASSHEALDADTALQEEVRNVGSAVAHAVGELRAGRLQTVQPVVLRPRRNECQAAGRRGCAKKKRSISPVASGPVASVYDPAAWPPDHA